MQKIVFLLLFIGSGIHVFSQQDFFVYFQADNHQPFYARINQNIYSSSESGYMIIPNLGDSTYQVVIGFAKNAFPEQVFPVTINRHDRGFQLKKQDDNGWSLVNLQNMSVTMSTGTQSKSVQELSGVRKTDAFSEMLANVVNDTAILYSSVKPKQPEIIAQKKPAALSNQEEKKIAEKETAPATDTVVSNQVSKEPVNPVEPAAKPTDTSTSAVAIVKEAPPASNSGTTDTTLRNADTKSKEPVIKERETLEKPFITRIEEKKTDDIYQATYLEQYVLTTDTVKITILLHESTATNPTPAPPASEKKTEAVTDTKIVTEEKPVITKPAVADTTASTSRPLVLTNSDCKSFAADNDLDKLRVKLISDKTIDDKMATAKKFYKNKCFSVKQIRALAELFPSDETKYHFLEMSYAFVSDTANFYRLEETIENDYYKNRFKALILK